MIYKSPFQFNFHIPTRIVFGEGILKEITKKLDVQGIRQAFVVGQHSLKDSSRVVVADPGMKSTIRRVKDPQEIIPVLMAAW
jgi:alcohol dehydrogenase class IV